MPRKQKEIVIDVNQVRADNYQSHFQKRRFVQALDEGFRVQAWKSIEYLPRTDLNIFGVDNYQPDDWDEILKVSVRLHLEPCYCIWWWWSDTGWAAFQELWQNLPEVVHIPLCTTDQVVLLCTQAEYGYPSSGRK